VTQGLVRGSQDDVTGVSVPCSMLWGASDRTHGKTDALTLHECVPNARISMFDHVGHFPDLEQPEKFAELLLAQIARLHAPRSVQRRDLA